VQGASNLSVKQTLFGRVFVLRGMRQASVIVSCQRQLAVDPGAISSRCLLKRTRRASAGPKEEGGFRPWGQRQRL